MTLELKLHRTEMSSCTALIGGANRRILVIDDNPAIHDDFRKILGAGLASATALSQSEAPYLGTRRRRRCLS